jgi:glycosyltransferase involved in cell wall biosynthesis
MALGPPIVGLATTEMATVVQNGVNGHVEADVHQVVEHARRLVLDREEAAALSAGARQTAKERFGIERFAADWSAVLQVQAGRGPLPHRRRHLRAHYRRRVESPGMADSTG